MRVLAAHHHRGLCNPRRSPEPWEVRLSTVLPLACCRHSLAYAVKQARHHLCTANRGRARQREQGFSSLMTSASGMPLICADRFAASAVRDGHRDLR